MRLQPRNNVISQMRIDPELKFRIDSLLENQKPEWAKLVDPHYEFECNGIWYAYVVDVGGMETVIRIAMKPASQ